MAASSRTHQLTCLHRVAMAMPVAQHQVYNLAWISPLLVTADQSSLG